MTSRTALPTNPFRPPERALPAQTRLDEFEIERALAQSSFAVVYRAYDHALKLHVAIKEYLPDALTLRSAETQVVLRARSHAERFEQGLQAFVAEAQTLARCEHPSLLRIARVLQRHGTAYRVMRYSPGPTLLQHRRELAAAPDTAAMRAWLDGLLGALEVLHEEGCVHGAVAPGNILLLHGGRALLLDFDAVRAALISDRTQSMMAALEPCFGPPEQGAPDNEGAMGPWSDLYALAATLHFCISGQLPAPPSAATRPFEPLPAVWQRLHAALPAPPWLAVLDACLAERAADRPQSVAEVRARLDALPLPGITAKPRAEAPTLSLADADSFINTLPRPAAPRAAPPPVAKAAAVPPAAAPSPTAPPPMNPVAPVDPAHAKVIADLDRTFAFIAAQANEDAAKPPAAQAAPTAPAAPAVPTADAAAQAPLARLRLLLLVGAALLALVLMGVAAVWMLEAYDPGLIDGTRIGGADTANWQAQAQAQAPAAAAMGAPPAAGRNTAAPVPPDAAPPARAKAEPPTSPRQACAGRERYALLKCMQTQCAKRTWTQHEQCVRLRKERQL